MTGWSRVVERGGGGGVDCGANYLSFAYPFVGAKMNIEL